MAATSSISQTLAEKDLKRNNTSGGMVCEMVPEVYREFLDVFDKGRLERLPQHCPHDLGIDLVDDASVPPPGKLYQLAPAELQALREFIDENLKKGYIQPSSMPCGTPVFFVKKKDESLRLVVNFWALNAVTRPDAYLIPLTIELLDRLKAAQVFTTLDMCWGYYNV